MLPFVPVMLFAGLSQFFGFADMALPPDIVLPDIVLPDIVFEAVLVQLWVMVL